MDGVFTIIQGKFPHTGVAITLYEVFHYGTLIHKKDSYQYENNSHINYEYPATMENKWISNNIHVTMSIQPTWHQRDLKYKSMIEITYHINKKTRSNIKHQQGSVQHNASQRKKTISTWNQIIIYLTLKITKEWVALLLDLKSPSQSWRRKVWNWLLTRWMLTPATSLQKVTKKYKAHMENLNAPLDSWRQVVKKRHKICPIWTLLKFPPPESWAQSRFRRPLF